MTQVLKQSTAVDVLIGPFVDLTDGATAETGESPSVKLSKNGQTLAAKNDVTTPVHDADGYYNCELDATDTNTVGTLILTVAASANALPVRHEFQVVEEVIYDALYASSAAAFDANQRVDVGSWLGTAVTLSATTSKPQVDVDSIDDDATAADNAELFFDGTGYAGGTTPLDVNVASIDASAITATSIATNAITSAKINGNAITAAKLAPDASAEIADAVWDEVLTGATHNVVNSAGRRLRQLQESGAAYGGFIWIDTVNGTAGTTSYENGTSDNPVDTIADANTLASAVGISRFKVAPGSTITFAAAQNNQVFEGSSWTLALGGQQIVGTTITGATVSGIAAGTGTSQYFIECLLNAATHIKGTHMVGCGVAGTQTVGEAGDYFFDRCHSAVAGTGTWSFSFGALIGNTNLNMRNYSGGIQLEAMGDTGTDTASIEGQGQVIEGTCTGGTVAIRGMFTTSGITNLTLSDDARIDVGQINGEMVDVITVDTISELAQAQPSATPTLATAVMLPYMTLRNKLDTTATTLEVHNNAGTVISKKTLSDDGTTYSEAQMVSGP